MKLTLNKDTIKRLDHEQLQKAVGGELPVEPGESRASVCICAFSTMCPSHKCETFSCPGYTCATCYIDQTCNPIDLDTYCLTFVPPVDDTVLGQNAD